MKYSYNKHKPTFSLIQTLETDKHQSRIGISTTFSTSLENIDSYVQTHFDYVPVNTGDTTTQFEYTSYTLSLNTSSTIQVLRSGDLTQNSTVTLYALSQNFLETMISSDLVLNAPKYYIRFSVNQSSASINTLSLESNATVLILAPFINSTIGLNNICTINYV